MCCEMSHPRARPLPWRISRDEIQLNAPQSLLLLSILMVCAEYKEAVRRVGWKAGKQLKSILCQQRLPREELGALQVPSTLCTRTGRTRRLGSVKPLISFLTAPVGQCCWGSIWMLVGTYTDELGTSFPLPTSRGVGVAVDGCGSDPYSFLICS